MTILLLLLLLLLLQDLAGADWLLQRNLPVTLVFTKMDKAKSKQAGPADNILAFRAALQAAGVTVPPHFATSAVKKQGGQQLLQYLAQRRAQAAQLQQQQLQQQYAAAVRVETPS
jgi:GTP-binding protein EngB required for normal cell division